MDENKQSPEAVDLIVSLRKLAKQGKRFWWLVVLVFALCIGFSTFRTMRGYVPRYQASATYAASGGIDGLTDISSTTSYYDTQMREQIVTTFSAIYATEGMQERVKKELQMDYLPGQVTVSAIGETYYFKMTAVADDPDTALELVKAVANVYPDAASFVIGAATLHEIEAPHAERSPITKISYTRSVGKGAAVAAVFCLLFLWLAAYRYRTVESRSDMKEITKAGCLGTLPNIHVKKRRKNGELQLSLMNPRVSSALETAVGTIRTALVRKFREDEATVVMITSTYAGEGKTTLSANLAVSLARSGKKVILVDADLRNQSLQYRFRTDVSGKGLLLALRNPEMKLQDTMTKVEGLPLFLLAGDDCADAPLKYLSAEKLSGLFSQLRQIADVVIVDSPPAGLLSDATLLGKYSDMVVYVVRRDGASKHQIADSMKELERTGMKLAGYVLNGGESGSGAGYGAYGAYGRYGTYGRYGRYGSYGSYGKRGKSEK